MLPDKIVKKETSEVADENLSITDALDALAAMLTNRNRERDDALAQYWMGQLGTHRNMLADIRLGQAIRRYEG